MTKPKIIFFDIDGTLVPLKEGIRPRTVEALQKLRQNGIKLCIATGRAPMEVPKFEGVTFDAFLTYNGEWNPEIISVDYDIERTAEEFSSSGLLEKSAVWGRGLLGTIRTGINYTVLAVRLVEKYSQETGLPVTDESLWERAAKELQIP